VTEPWHDVEWVADYLGVSSKTVRRRAADLGAKRLGSRLLFRASGIDRFLESQSLGPRRARRERQVFSA
jgi:hypothetical protein